MRYSVRLDTPPRFICDVHLAKTAKYLRLLGFDAGYGNNILDNELLGMSRFGRFGLTCDKELHMRSPETIILLKCDDASVQVKYLSSILHLSLYARPFRRSLCCNRLMVPVDKQNVRDKIPKETYRWLNSFWQCPKCKKVYWRGTHMKRMRKKIVELLKGI